MCYNASRTKGSTLHGLVKVSTGALQLEKLSAGDASNRKVNINAEENLAYAA